MVILAAVFVGSYVQGVTGFALGIMVMAIVTVAGVMEVAPMAAVISVIALVNVAVALHGHLRDIDRRLFTGLTLGQIPGIFAGLWLLDWLSADATAILELILGIFIVAGSISMAIRPTTKARRSPQWTAIAAGAGGGLTGGMFAASGPVTGWYSYRQPIPVAVVRASLLAGLMVTTIVRTVAVGFSGHLTTAVLTVIAASLPMVAVGTVLARRFPPVLSEPNMRRLVFTLLLVIGVWIVASASMDWLRV